MVIKDGKLQKYKNKIERRIERNKEKIKEYEINKENLSIHGHWSLGYYAGKNNELENLLDEILELLKEK